MTAEEHDRAYTKTFEEGELLRDFIKCDAIVNRLASKFPDDHRVWVGSVSERLAYIAGLLTHEEWFEDMTSKAPQMRRMNIFTPKGQIEPIGFFPIDPNTYHEHPDCKLLKEKDETCHL
jgi:hypothetical protein